MDEISKLQEKVKTLEERVKRLQTARDQLSRDWLGVEREMAIFEAAIQNMPIGCVICDDYKKVTFKNEAVDQILGEKKQWSVEDIQEIVGVQHNILGAIDECFHSRKQINPFNVVFNDRKLRFFMSPIVIIKKSINAIGVVLLIAQIN